MFRLKYKLSNFLAKANLLLHFNHAVLCEVMLEYNVKGCSMPYCQQYNGTAYI